MSNNELWYMSDDYKKEFLPFWASGYAKGRYIEGAQLCTRDGRVMGNGVVIDIYQDNRIDEPIFKIKTDIGNIVELTYEEICEIFYLPKFILKNFPYETE